MKRGIAAALVLALLLALLPAQAFAADTVGVYNGMVYKMNASGCTITSYTDNLPADLVIPEEIEGKPVRSIAYDAFMYCKQLRTVQLPAQLHTIEGTAFAYSGLTGFIDFPASIQRIDSLAFYQTGVIGARFAGAPITGWLPDMPRQLIVAPEEFAPEYLTNGTFLPSETFDEAFLKAARYEEDGVTYLVCEDFAAIFIGADRSLVTIPDKVQGVDVTWIMEDAFQGCNSLKTLRLPQSIARIDYCAFNGAGITSFKAPEALKEIGDYAFGACYSLQSLDLSGVERVGDHAFYQCYELSSIQFGNDLTEVGENAFGENRKITALVLPESLNHIGKGAFYGFTALESLTLPPNLTELPDNFLSRCSALTELTLPESVVSIGANALSGTALSHITLPAAVRTVGKGAFSGMSKLQSITLAEGLETIGQSAFDNCPLLESLTLPASVKLVESVPDVVYGTVYYHTGTSFALPRSTTHTINFVDLDTGKRKQMFYDYWQDGICYFIQEKTAAITKSGVDIPEELIIPSHVEGLPVTEIGAYSIKSWSLHSVTLPDTLEKIGAYAFHECPFLYGLEIPPSVTFCGSDGEEAIIYTSAQGRQNRSFYILAQEGSYGLAYAKKNFYRVYEQKADGPEYKRLGSHLFTIDGGQATLVLSCGLTAETLDVVPGYVDGIPVTKIATGAYAYANLEGSATTTLAGVIWSEPLQIIEDGAFSNDTSPMVLTIPDTVSSIGENAFGYWKHVILGLPGSYAEDYAKEKDYEFYNLLALTPFEDVDENAWYYDAVCFCYWNGLMQGTSETTFVPNGITSRAMLVQVFFNIAGDPGASDPSVFEDVADNAWYAQAINWAYANKITSGTSATTFSPNRPVTREQVATFLFNFAGAIGRDTGKRASLDAYKDLDQVSSWAEEALQWCVAEGIISGTDSTSLSPKNSATRAQIATILMRFVSEEE